MTNNVPDQWCRNTTVNPIKLSWQCMQASQIKLWMLGLQPIWMISCHLVKLQNRRNDKHKIRDTCSARLRVVSVLRLPIDLFANLWWRGCSQVTYLAICRTLRLGVYNFIPTSWRSIRYLKNLGMSIQWACNGFNCYTFTGVVVLLINGTFPLSLLIVFF